MHCPPAATGPCGLFWGCDPGIPIPAGSARSLPSTYTARWAWMWYASCSVGPQLIPSTAPVCVVPGDARSGPTSSGTPSNPTGSEEDPGVTPAAVLEVLCPADADELELEDEEVPQPAT